MSEKTNIEWATSTGNPWIGCTMVSEGCVHCYAAELDANKFSKTMGGATPEHPISHWGKGAPRVRTKQFWKDAVKWNSVAGRAEIDRTRDLSELGIDEPYERPRVFPSLCDWLDDEVPIEWLADFLKLIYETPNLDWLLLTKRPELWRARVKDAWHVLYMDGHLDAAIMVDNWQLGISYPHNVWAGTSIENQDADKRIPELLKIPARVRFLSVEPLLDNVNLKEALPFSEDSSHACGYPPQSWPGVDWIIVGGESGKNRRDCGVDAIVSVAKQCREAGVPCFVKQDCAFKPGQQGRIPAHIWAMKEFPR